MSRQKDDKSIINEFVYLSSKLYNELLNDNTNKYMKEKINYLYKNLGYSNKLLNLFYNMKINDSKRYSFKQIS